LRRESPYICGAHSAGITSWQALIKFSARPNVVTARQRLRLQGRGFFPHQARSTAAQCGKNFAAIAGIEMVNGSLKGLAPFAAAGQTITDTAMSS